MHFSLGVPLNDPPTAVTPEALPLPLSVNEILRLPFFAHFVAFLLASASAALMAAGSALEPLGLDGAAADEPVPEPELGVFPVLGFLVLALLFTSLASFWACARN